jgi:ABC-type Fe3+/spermidine/putrescine transport system ATPase subunit
MSTGSIRIKGLSHSYGATAVLKDIHLDVSPGEFVAIVGPSGSGKSTLLSLLSGYLKPSSGVLERTGTTRTVKAGCHRAAACGHGHGRTYWASGV